ncbi:MAG: tetratricopeptide repeat protein [Terriglobia bacterium]
MRKIAIGFGAMLLGVSIVFAQHSEHFRRGLQALQQNHLQQALEELTLAEQDRPSDARVHNFRGIVLTRLGKQDDAAAEYREAIQLDPKLVAAYRNFGLLEFSEGHIEEARVTLSKALELAPSDSYARYDLGEVELHEGKFQEAFRDLEGSKLPWPSNPDFLLRAAAGYASLHRRDDALQTASRLEGMPLSSAQSVSLGSLLASLQEKDKSLALFQRLEREHPGAYWAELDLALAEQTSGNSREAAARAASLAARTKCWEAWSIEGIADAQLGEHDLSIKAFREAAKLDPQQQERWLDLTRELMEVQKYDPAIESAQQGLQYNPRSYALRLRLGAAYLNGGRYRQAERVFRDLIAHNDPFPTSAIGLAQVLLRTGQMKEAAAAIVQTQKRIGDDFLLAYFRGIALERCGQPENAVVSFQDALHFDPQNPEAHRWLGEVELQAEHAPAAIKQLTESLKLNPSDAQARLLLSRAYRMARNPQAAAALAHEVMPGALPKAGGGESQDFFTPSWQMPPAGGA